MGFFNRATLLYAVIVLIATLCYYYIASHWFVSSNGDANIWLFFVYLFILFASAFLISFKDEHSGYAGFNYHLITYIICNGLPLILASCNVFPKDVIGQVFYVMMFWGIGLLFHLAMYIFIFRKKRIGSYEKEDVFK